MTRRLILPLVCLATVLAGCGDEEKSGSNSSAKPPENLCEAVAPAVPEDWELTRAAADRGKAKTSCTLADDGGGTTLVVTLVKPRSGGVDAAYEELCDTYLGGEPQERDDEQCTLTGPMKVGGSPAQLQRAVRLDSPEGVLWVTFRTNDADHAADAQDVLDDVEDAVSQD